MSDRETAANAGAFRRSADSLAVATMFLTRLPVRARHTHVAAAAAAFPLVGLVVGALGGATYWLAATTGLPPTASAFSAIAATVLATGALHEDGLADAADGLAGATPDDAIRIMRDSRTGTYGVLALLFGVGLRVAALAAIADSEAVFRAMLAAGALSRAAMPPAMLWLRPAAGTGLAATAGRPGAGGVTVAVCIGAVAAVIVPGLPEAAAAIAAAAGAALLVAVLARRRLGGYTGDVLGAIQQASEVAVLLVIAAML